MRGVETADSSDFDSEYVFEKMTQGKETYFENYEIAAERHFAYSVDNGRDDCGGTGPDVGCDGCVSVFVKTVLERFIRR